ncbi:(S)-ureidoglycine aminohydrolase [Jiella avicenniae]|uniref:(S)-ureidoglycine aminohydrolase n=1 Tax=Jiella avicenniae TaxID=2907202 RepID=A0A9X1P3B4_9HYPH|nr:(S)-ureidoglycine aminohydrolase [Jiella avicenniae]MCE7029491.1 hypothetical protein [Jiella avicenniae]
MPPRLRPDFGGTRSVVKARHALLTPESHEKITQPGWPGCEFVTLISPDMGAKFAMSLVEAHDGLTAPPAMAGVARFLFCLDGEIAMGGETMGPESFAFLPPDDTREIALSRGTRLVLFEWRFVPRGDIPGAVTGTLADTAGKPLRGDDRLIVQKMLPTDAAFDCEFNVMSFEPGASLAYVEVHFMEHGLLFLDGGGIYRLDEDWLPVTDGDAIWMGPHVPQWFGALGREASRYLIYKNYNRSPLSPR